MAKKKTHRSGRSFTVPIAVIGGFAAGMVEPATDLISGNPWGAMDALARNYTGYDRPSGTWNPGYLARGALPLIVGIVVHKAASKLGVNRELGQAGVPLIRV